MSFQGESLTRIHPIMYLPVFDVQFRHRPEYIDTFPKMMLVRRPEIAFIKD